MSQGRLTKEDLDPRLVEEIENNSTRLEEVDERNEHHTNDLDNPHGVTAEQLALGNVQNFGVANQAEAETGTSTTKYMTPQRTKQAIDKNLVTISQTVTNLGEQVTTHLDGDVANVKDFGAEGDGITNDFEAIRAAINTGREVYLPQGTFYIGASSLTNVKSLKGAGKNLTKLVNSGINPVISNVNVESFLVSDLSIENRDGTGTGINVSAGSYSVIENVFFHKLTNGIIIANTQALRINNIDMWSFSNYGIFLNGSNNDIFISNCFINGEESGTAGNGTGIRMYDKAEAITFDSVEVILCKLALSTYAVNNIFNARPAYCVFSNCYFDSSTEGVILDRIVNFKFEQCWFSNRPSSGCILNTVDDVTFNNCSFINNAQHGCVVQSTAKRVKFLGCSFISNSTTSPNTYHGLTFGGDTADFIVKGCTATNGIGMNGIQSAGILVNSGASNRYIISDNLVSGNGSNGVVDYGTGTNKKVENNF